MGDCPGRGRAHTRQRRRPARRPPPRRRPQRAAAGDVPRRPAQARPARRGAAAVEPGSVGHVIPTPGIGVPDGRMGIQDQVTPIGHEAQAFHDNLAAAAVRDHQPVRPRAAGLCDGAVTAAAPIRRRRATRTTPLLEVVWTLVPVLILVAIAIPSIRLLRHQYSPPPGRRDGQGHRPPMVLDLRISRQWRAFEHVSTC